MRSAYDRKILARIAKIAEEMGPEPDCCPKCKGELEYGSGMVGETVLYCPDKKCIGIVWEDVFEAHRTVL
jgi:hypothetical protein